MLNIFSEGVLFWAGITMIPLIALLIAGTWNYGEFKKRGLAFSKPTPFLGNFGPFAIGKKSQGNQSIDMYNQFKGHRAFGYFMFTQPIVVIREPDLIRLVSVKDFDVFTDHFGSIDEKDDKLFGKTLFSLKGDRWRAMRHILAPAFDSAKIKNMYALMDKCGEQLADYLFDKCNDGLVHLEMQDLFSKYANDVIATAVYGVHCDSLAEPDNEFYKMGLEITNFGPLRLIRSIAFMLCPNISKFVGIRLAPWKLENFFCSIVNDTMATREREKIIRPDMINFLMEARQGTLKKDERDDGPNKKELTDDDITSQAFIFFIAGFITTSTHLSFLSYQLAVNPEVQEKVQQEIDEVLADNGGVLSYDAVQKMKYLDTVISETLRLWPSVIELNRICLRDYVVPATASSPAVIIKKGDGVQIPVLAIHRDPEYWPEPERFDPDRFSEENKHNIKPFTYIPFGCGPRNCIGNRFALMETKIAMANVLAKVTLEVTEKTPIPIRLQKGTFNVRPEGGMWLGFKARKTKALGHAVLSLDAVKSSETYSQMSDDN